MSVDLIERKLFIRLNYHQQAHHSYRHPDHRDFCLTADQNGRLVMIHRQTDCLCSVVNLNDLIENLNPIENQIEIRLFFRCRGHPGLNGYLNLKMKMKNEKTDRRADH
jgi:hypothetical protein